MAPPLLEQATEPKRAPLVRNVTTRLVVPSGAFHCGRAACIPGLTNVEPLGDIDLEEIEVEDRVVGRH
jgi:hypothetical protein